MLLAAAVSTNEGLRMLVLLSHHYLHSLVCFVSYQLARPFPGWFVYWCSKPVVMYALYSIYV